MILLDSSAWLEIFVDGPLAGRFEKRLAQSGGWIVSTINTFEVYRKIAKHSEDKALQAIAYMRTGTVLPVTEELALEAADLSLEHGLGMADSLILATAYAHKAKLVTKDNDFRGIAHCEVVSS